MHLNGHIMRQLHDSMRLRQVVGIRMRYQRNAETQMRNRNRFAAHYVLRAISENAQFAGR